MPALANMNSNTPLAFGDRFMTHDNPPPGKLFSDEEWQRLQTEDVQAGKAIIYLMSGIFAIGLVLYMIVAWSVT